jgi:hypothetical protein
VIPTEAAMSDPTAPDLEFVETWRSQVFLTPTAVWKIKKPVHLGTLDYTTLDARRRACESELALNRILAPDVYRGLTPVTKGPDGRRCIGGQGDTIDWAVHMTRLPDRERADQRIREDRLDDDAVCAIAHAVAAFHERAPRIAGRAAAMLRTAIDLEPPRSDTAHTTSLPKAAEEAACWQRNFLDEHAVLFEQRAAAGHLRDGHGNLSLEHVFVADDGRVRIINRLEFDARLRQLDVSADIASLSTDLAAAGRADLAERFLADYAAEANDFDLYPLVDFYASLRASVQGKIEWFYADHFGDDALRADERRLKARRCFKLAASAPRQPLLPPAVVAVGGLVASGKSTVARHLAREIGAPVVSSDRTRDFLLGARLSEDLHEVHWEAAYEQGFCDRVYDEVMRRAGAVLSSGRPVVVDGCFRSAAQRSRAQAQARRFGHPFLFVETRVPDDVNRQRLRERSIRDAEPDSTWLEIADELRSQWEPTDELPPEERETVDTSLPLAHNAERLRTRLPTWPAGLTS